MTADLVRSIYEACLEPARWREAMAQIATAVGSHGGHLMLWDERRAAPLFNLDVGVGSPDAGRLYEAYYGGIDPRRQYAMARPVGEWNPCHRICDDKVVAGNEFYQDYLIPTVGCRYMAGVRLAAEDGLHAMLAIGRRADRRAVPFEESELRLLRALTPHLRLAVRMQSRIGRLENETALREEALDLLTMAVFIVDRDSAVRYANAAADALLNDPQGPVRSRSGRLQARIARQSAVLDGAVKAAVDRGEGGGLALSAGQRGACHCVVVPLGPRLQSTSMWQRPTALLLVSNAAPGCVVDRKLLQALFRLTPSEARLAAGLAGGRTLEAVAAESAVSILTVRAHLRAVFVKVGVNRQADLLALLERLAQTKPRSGPGVERER
jgi:DNA-binding CsgD family transcriptional regulator/PAS domain-containing protein